LGGGKAVDPTPGRWKQWPGNVKIQRSPFKIHNILIIKGDWKTRKRKTMEETCFRATADEHQEMRPNPCLRQLVSSDTTIWPYKAEDRNLNCITLCPNRLIDHWNCSHLQIKARV
jgi:hypothetical protein